MAGRRSYKYQPTPPSSPTISQRTRQSIRSSRSLLEAASDLHTSTTPSLHSHPHPHSQNTLPPSLPHCLLSLQFTPFKPVPTKPPLGTSSHIPVLGRHPNSRWIRPIPLKGPNHPSSSSCHWPPSTPLDSITIPSDTTSPIMQGHTVQEDAASNQIPAATKVMAIRELYDQILGLMNLEDKLKCARLNKEWRESMYNTPITMEQFKEEWIEFRKKLRHIKAHCVVQTVLQKHKCEEGVCPAEDCPQENNPPELAATDVVQCCFHPETAFNEMVRHTNEYMTSNPEATYNCSRTDETRRKVWNGATRQEIIWTVSKEASFTWRDSYGYVEPDAHDGTMEVDN